MNGISNLSIDLHDTLVICGAHEEDHRVDEGAGRLRMFLAGGIRVLEFDDEDARISGKIRAGSTASQQRQDYIEYDDSLSDGFAMSETRLRLIYLLK